MTSGCVTPQEIGRAFLEEVMGPGVRDRVVARRSR